MLDWIRRTTAYFFGQRWVRFGIVGMFQVPIVMHHVDGEKER